MAADNYRLFFSDHAHKQYVFEEDPGIFGVNKRTLFTGLIVFGLGLSVGVTSVAVCELLRFHSYGLLLAVGAFAGVGLYLGSTVARVCGIYHVPTAHWVDDLAIGAAALGIWFINLLGFLHPTAHLRNVTAGLIGGSASLAFWRIVVWATVDDSRKAVLNVVASTEDDTIVVRNDSDFQIKWLVFDSEDLVTFVPIGGIAGAGAVFTDPGQQSVIRPPVDADQFLVKVYSGWERQSGQFIVSRGGVYSFSCVDRLLVSKKIDARDDSSERDMIRFRNLSSKNVLICVFVHGASDAAPRIPFLVARFLSQARLAHAWVGSHETHCFDMSGIGHQTVVIRVATHWGMYVSHSVKYLLFPIFSFISFDF